MDLLKLYSDSFQDHWRHNALTDFTTGRTLTYGDFAAEIAATHLLFRQCGIKPGDKIALGGPNCISWVTVYMATITYGATIVPLSGKYEPQETTEILRHSDAVMLFMSDGYLTGVDFNAIPQLRMVISLDRTAVEWQRENDTVDAQEIIAKLPSEFKELYPGGFSPSDIQYPTLPSDTVIAIDYTSGTTGAPKGAMITTDNIGGNVAFGIQARVHRPASRCLAFLPLSHAFGGTFDMLVPLAVGGYITLFDHALTMSALFKALSQVKPYTILFVPSVFEKVVAACFKPLLDRKSVTKMLHFPVAKKVIYKIFRHRLNRAMGQHFREVVIGGAPIDRNLEEFLFRIGFRFTVGYGMIECAPLVSYTFYDRFRRNSCGQVIKGIMQVKVADDTLPGEPGEICVKGMNLMKGYYKNPAATSKVIDRDGWFHTGDIGTVDSDGTIFLKGRQATVIDGPDNCPIYPEQIEFKLLNMPYVAECIIVKRDDRLVAVIHPDYEAAAANGIDKDDLPGIMSDNIVELNRLLPLREYIHKLEIKETEFNKTTKFTIKRHLYS